MSKIKKRSDGRYRMQVYLETGADGKLKYRYFYGTTRKEVEAKAAAFRAALGKGLDPDRQGETLGDLLDSFVAQKQAQGVGAKTLRGYQAAGQHFAPLLGVPADKLRAADFQRLLNDLADWHDGQPPLSTRTLHLIYTTGKAAFELAIPEVVQYNPLSKVTVPTGAPAHKREALTPQQQAWVRETPHRAQRAAMLMLYSGLRRGEASALTWADVDLAARTISVTKSIDFATGKVKAPKTAAGVRTVAIPQLLADYLATQQDGCLYVLHTADGKRMTETAWRSLWRSYMTDLNVKYGYGGDASKYDPAGLQLRIPTWTPHQLRHTFCTLLYEAGVDVLAAKEQMGHSSISVTMDIYTHLDAAHKKRSVAKLDALLAAAAPSDAPGAPDARPADGSIPIAAGAPGAASADGTTPGGSTSGTDTAANC